MQVRLRPAQSQVFISDQRFRLRAAARFTVKLWQKNGFDGLLHMPAEAIEMSEQGVPRALRIHLDYQWMPHRGQSWAKFQRFVQDEVEEGLARYRQASQGAWGKARKAPSYTDLQFLAKYQANQIGYHDDSEYKRIARTAAQLGLTLRPKNVRTKKH